VGQVDDLPRRVLQHPSNRSSRSRPPSSPELHAGHRHNPGRFRRLGPRRPCDGQGRAGLGPRAHSPPGLVVGEGHRHPLRGIDESLEQDGLGVSAIADRLSLEPSTITPLVKRLESAGFLTRERNPKDERQVIIRLTDKSRPLYEKTACLTDTLLERSGLTPQKLAKLNARVRKLRDALAGA